MSRYYFDYAVYDAADGCFNDSIYDLEGFDDFGNQLVHELYYEGYEFSEYVRLSNLRHPVAGCCLERGALSGDG